MKNKILKSRILLAITWVVSFTLIMLLCASCASSKQVKPNRFTDIFQEADKAFDEEFNMQEYVL